MSDIGFSLTRSEVIETVTYYLISIQANHLFKNGEPTKNWYYSFLARLKDKLFTKKTNNTPCNRAQSTNPVVIDCWFEGTPKFTKNIPTKLGVSNNKQMYTILACCSAQGEFMPLHIYTKVYV